MLQIDDKYKDKIAIVVVGYNRLTGLKRLLSSIEKASYHNNDIPLVISIDCSENVTLYKYIIDYQWIYGEKYVNIQTTRLGLKEHIFQCGRLTKYFKGIILLEDDLYVSPDFYNYANAALNKYGDDKNIAAIALYTNELNGFIGLPYRPINNGSDCFAWQAVCSWGEIWNKRMWDSFEEWLRQWNEDFSKIDMPEEIKTWTRAWSKYFYAYIICNDKYFIYPYVSLSTNFNDMGGEHGGGESSLVQVSLQIGERNYNFFDFNNLVKYDVYQQNTDLYKYLNISANDLSLDLYGMRLRFRENRNKRYILTTMKAPYKVVKSFGLCMRPIELNVLENINGESIYLYDTSIKEKSGLDISYETIQYFLQGFNFKYLLSYVAKCIVRKIK